MTNFKYDVLIIGSGAAGLTAALKLAPHLRIALLSKSTLNQGATYLAQGGIAGVLNEQDSIDSHVQDTLIAGGGLCDEEAVRFTVSNSQNSIQWLIDQGVPFTREENPEGNWDYHLTREGGHSRRRIIHAADETGKAVSNTLTELVRAQANIDTFENHLAVDLVVEKEPESRAIGAYILDLKKGRVDLFLAKSTILATGGASKAYLYSSNPQGASGDGIAIAWRAGCRIANMEFNQFHPTILYHPHAYSFLITEAVRGEGGKLLRPDGSRFMDDYDQRAELAPRDVVARAIDGEMKRLGSDFVYLDISHKSPEFIEQHFPNIKARCLELGIDMTKQPIPVVPSAHYTCGGIMVDNNGCTDLPGLYSIGESSFTGLHGANRMASNSLLECLVYAQSASEDILRKTASIPEPAFEYEWDESRVTISDEDVVVSHNWEELRRVMWDYVGIVRSDKQLKRAEKRIALIRQEVAEHYGRYKISGDLLELRNLIVVSELIIQSALMRKESRGLHYTLDYPDSLEVAENTVLRRTKPFRRNG